MVCEDSCFLLPGFFGGLPIICFIACLLWESTCFLCSLSGFSVGLHFPFHCLDSLGSSDFVVV